MFCTICGQKMRDGELFCPNCGTRVISINNSAKTKNPEMKQNGKVVGVSKEAAEKIREYIEENTSSPKKFGERWYSWSAGEILRDPIADSLAELVTGIDDEIPLIVFKYNRTSDIDFKEGFIVTNYRIIFNYSGFNRTKEEWFWNEITGVKYDKRLFAHVMYLTLNIPGYKDAGDMYLTYLDHLKEFKIFFEKLIKICAKYAQQ